MNPIRDFRPIIRFSDIKTWFSTRQQSIIQGIRKIISGGGAPAASGMQRAHLFLLIP